VYNVRGAGKDVDIVFFDEWGFFSHAVLPALLPTLANGAVAVMTTSVPPDPDSPMMQLIDVKFKDGTPVVRKLNWIKSCRDCERRGKECPHRTKQPEAWQTFAGQERLEAMMSVVPDSYAREMENKGGTPSMVNAFETAAIDDMVARKHTLRGTINHIFITIDPSSGVLRCCAGGPADGRLASLALITLTSLGKDRNLYALLSTVFIGDECVVCYIQISTTTSERPQGLGSERAPRPENDARDRLRRRRHRRGRFDARGTQQRIPASDQ
jgi:hypothetical protein